MTDAQICFDCEGLGQVQCHPQNNPLCKDNNHRHDCYWCDGTGRDIGKVAPDGHE